MPYKHPIPDAPIAPSMLPRVPAENLTPQDVLVLTQPGNNPGEKNKGLELGALFEAMRSSLPTDTLVVDESDEYPSRYLIRKFKGNSAASYLDNGDVGFNVVTIRGAQFIIGVIENQAVTTDKLADDAVTSLKIANGGVSNVNLADDSVSTRNIFDGNVTTAKIADDAVTPEKIDETGDYTVKSMTVTDSVDAPVVKGNVMTDSIAPKTAGQPISVIGNLSIVGNVSLTGATAGVSARSITTERLFCSKLSLKDNGMSYAPALPYFVDTNYSYDGDLSRYCAGAPSGGRVTFVNATGSNQTYHFNGVSNGKSGYFTLKDGHAVDLLVFNALSSTQVSLVPIGIDFSTGG